MANILAQLPLRVLKLMLAETVRTDGEHSQGARELRREIERRENPQAAGVAR